MFLFKVVIYWPSFIIGMSIVLFFLFGAVDGVIFRNGAEYHVFNILSDIAQAYQSAPPGEVMVEVCSYPHFGIDFPGGSASENVCVLTGETRTLSNIAVQVIRFANSVYFVLVGLSGCGEAFIRYGRIVCDQGAYRASRNYAQDAGRMADE
ncbi:hypothetical protein C9I36_03885 [Pectobacterium punjabense]|nr:hypothetical protein C9I36_03885 [Pectobacterium punjabense]